MYLFSETTWTCAQVARHTTWDARLGATGQLLEFKLAWPGSTQPTMSTSYTVVTPVPVATANPPAAGKGFALWVRGPVVGSNVETPASGSNVTVTAYNAGTNATGTFQLTFGANTVSGSFDAKWCPPPAGEP
jgi:hypothetical protein